MVRLPDPEGPSAAKKMREESTSQEKERRPPLPQWHTAHRTLSGNLELFRQGALFRKRNLSVNPTAVIEYTQTYITEKGIADGIFYIPASKNQVALDSFIMHEGILYLFQFTTEQSHNIRDGLLSFLTKGSGFSPSENIRFIFVIPGDVVMKTLFARSAELAKIPLYSFIVEVKKIKDLSISFSVCLCTLLTPRYDVLYYANILSNGQKDSLIDSRNKCLQILQDTYYYKCYYIKTNTYQNPD
jgi:hypothetical protein